MSKVNQIIGIIALNVTLVTTFIYLANFEHIIYLFLPFLVLLAINYFTCMKITSSYSPLKNKQTTLTKGVRLSSYLSFIVILIFFIFVAFTSNIIKDDTDPLLTLLKINIALLVIVFLINIVSTITFDYITYGSKIKQPLGEMIVQYTLINLGQFGISILIIFMIGMGFSGFY